MPTAEASPIKPTSLRRALLILLACATMAALGAALGLLVWASGRWFMPLVALAIAALLSNYARSQWRRRAAVRDFRAAHPGKDLLLVYTDSPQWFPYIEQQWVPKWPGRVVTLNRSRPWSATQPEARLWRLLGGSREHTPLAIVVPMRGRPEVIRFWRAFRDFKHGKERPLRAAEARLADAMHALRP